MENIIYTKQNHSPKKDQYTQINGIILSIRKMEEKYFCLDIYWRKKNPKKLVTKQTSKQPKTPQTEQHLNWTVLKPGWVLFVHLKQPSKTMPDGHVISLLNWISDLSQINTYYIVCLWSIVCCLGDLNNIHFSFQHIRNYFDPVCLTCWKITDRPLATQGRWCRNVLHCYCTEDCLNSPWLLGQNQHILRHRSYISS